MVLEDRINRARDLIAKRDEIDAELAALLGAANGKTRKCTKCGAEGHRADRCPNPTPANDDAQ